jgi:ABC-type Zn uptake system ZnuABC Zn-binding protein ZnuA
MDTEYQELKKLHDVKLVTVTASFGNWQKLYGIDVYPLCLSRYGALPTEEQLAYIEKVITDNQVKYIVHDSTLPDDMQELYEKVKTDLNLTEIELSSLSRLSDDDVEKNRDYKTIMYTNLTNLLDVFRDNR